MFGFSSNSDLDGDGYAGDMNYSALENCIYINQRSLEIYEPTINSSPKKLDKRYGFCNPHPKIFFPKIN